MTTVSTPVSPSTMPGSGDPSELARFNALAARWWDSKGSMRPLHALNPVRLEYVLSALKARAEGPSSLTGSRVLDVGCGGGLLSEAMARSGLDVLGIDLAHELVQVAQLHAAEHEVEVRYQCADIVEMAKTPEYQSRFDAVTCMEMLEHVPDPKAVISALLTVLKPGGLLFLSTINRTPRAFALGIVAAEYLLGLLPRGTHRFDRLIKPSELSAWLRASGAELKRIDGLEYQPFRDIARLSPDLSINYLLSATRVR
jgi:2-polyprenyl-6-hydroxyphenyl methylase/3-demethylubiquinone-9 3-methyltransferase